MVLASGGSRGLGSPPTW